MSHLSHRDVTFFVVTCLLLATSSMTQEQDIKEVDVTQGGVATLNCNNTSNQSLNIPPGYSPVSWMIPYPSLTMVNQNSSKYVLLDSVWTLEISNAQNEDLGLYHCMLNNSRGDWYLVRIGVNTKGPYFVDPWNTYWLNTVIAFASLVGFLVLTALIFIIYFYRYIPEEVQEQERIKRESQALGVYRGTGSFKNEYPMKTLSSNGGIAGTDDVSTYIKPAGQETATPSTYTTLSNETKMMSVNDVEDVGQDNKAFNDDDIDPAVVKSKDVVESKEDALKSDSASSDESGRQSSAEETVNDDDKERSDVAELKM